MPREWKTRPESERPRIDETNREPPFRNVAFRVEDNGERINRFLAERAESDGAESGGSGIKSTSITRTRYQKRSGSAFGGLGAIDSRSREIPPPTEAGTRIRGERKPKFHVTLLPRGVRWENLGGARVCAGSLPRRFTGQPVFMNIRRLLDPRTLV